MSKFPLEPLYAKALLISKDYNCVKEMLAAVAMLSVESIFYAPRDKIKEVIVFVKADALSRACKELWVTMLLSCYS